MVLRRPFAFFIKHFRFVHFILAILTAFLSYNTIKIVTFFNEYMRTTATLVDKDVTRQLFPPTIFISVFMSLIITTAILILMRWKDKPILLYIINIVNTAYMWGIYIYSKQIVMTLETSFVDLKTLKLIHDLLIIGLIFQGLNLVITAVRSTGFDFKKFDFESDLDLEIDDTDSEEFEFDVDVDTDKFKRDFKRFVRHLKYAYQENKLVTILSGLLIIGLVASIIYVNSGVYSKVYKVGDTFRTTYFSFGVVESYSTSKNYHGDKLTNNKLIVVKIKAKNMSRNDMQLETGKIALTDKYKTFYHNEKYQNTFMDVGNTYVNDEISKENFDEYLLVYEIPSELAKDKLYLKYHDTKDKTITVLLRTHDLDDKYETKKYTITDKIDFDGSLVGNTKLEINKYEIKDRFKHEYRFCISVKDCYHSYEYIVPTAEDNYNKTLLKLDGTFKFDENLNVKKINNMSEFIEIYGSLNYKVNGLEKTVYNLKSVSPKKTNLLGNGYFEVPEELKNADSITLKISIRNKIYVYRLK